MLNVKKISDISFGQLNFHKNGDRLVFDDFTCKDSNNEDCFVKSEKDKLDNFKETVKIYQTKDTKQHVAENKNHFYNEIKLIYDDYMETLNHTQYKKGRGYTTSSFLSRFKPFATLGGKTTINGL